MRLTLLVMAASVLCAQPLHAAERAKPAEAPYISETLVVAPRQVGDFMLRDMKYDPASKYAGVGVRYAHVHHPDTPIDLFVFPAGRHVEADAVRAGMDDLRASFGEAEKAGYYRDVKLGETVGFEVRRTRLADDNSVEPRATDATPPTSEPASAEATRASDGDSAGTVAALRALLDPQPVKGERISLTSMRDDGAVRSRGYIFYKQLYFFKGRVTASDREMSDAEFGRLTDEAMRELVPSVQALNVGSCGDVSIVVDVDEPDNAKRTDALIRSLGEALAKQEHDNCVTSLNAEERARHTRDAEVVSISFDASDWSSK